MRYHTSRALFALALIVGPSLPARNAGASERAGPTLIAVDPVSDLVPSTSPAVTPVPVLAAPGVIVQSAIAVLNAGATTRAAPAIAVAACGSIVRDRLSERTLRSAHTDRFRLPPALLAWRHQTR